MLQKIRTLGQLKGKINLITLQGIERQNLFQNILKFNQNLIITSTSFGKMKQHQSFCHAISNKNNIRIVPNYLPLVDYHHKQNNLSLLIGDENKQLISQLDPTSIITLEQLCKIFPEKVPLSFRKENHEQLRKKLERRINRKIQKLSEINFGNILIINQRIKMWDEAKQVILDCQPSPIIFPYSINRFNKQMMYKLTLNDFISGLRIVHTTVSKAVKNHPDLNIIAFEQQKQLNWIISHVANQATSMCIDHQFFEKTPKIDSCGGKQSVKIIQSLNDLFK